MIELQPSNPKSLRICVCTSLEAIQEPRAPRHAAWLAEIGEHIEVVFIDSSPLDSPRRLVKVFDGFENLHWLTHYFSARSSSFVQLILDRGRFHVLRLLFRLTGIVSAGALSSRVFGLAETLDRIDADVYVCHNIETLLPAYIAAQKRGAMLMFDSMEFHSDMGDSQSALDRSITQQIERQVLPTCDVIFASSDRVADALVEEYGITRPIALYNVPPVEFEIANKPLTGLSLYWRNSVVGFGQRGLEEALAAMVHLPLDVTLHLQGRMPADGGQVLRERITELQIVDRVVIHQPYAPESAVREASLHHVGLCLERKGVKNHELTVSNKIFDYHMAGLAIIASNLPALRDVVENSSGGLLFEPGSIEDLVHKILMLYEDRSLLNNLASNARKFALVKGNRDIERQKFVLSFSTVCDNKLG
jgi:glycosyltransferase involved in cell wall biosynthesis